MAQVAHHCAPEILIRRYNITDVEDKKEAAKKVAEYNRKRRSAVSE
ncbi:MAG: hypothetical protein WB869_11465 [Candidatus Acidiferrales bacterium]